MASVTLDLLIGRIISFVEDEALSIQGVGDEIEEFKLELISMRSFLEDADKKGILTKREKTWVSIVRDLAYEVEDIIDEFMYHMNGQRNWGKYAKFYHKIFRTPKNLWARHQMSTKLQKINRRIKNIPERIQRYGVSHLEGMSSRYNSQWVKNHGESSLFMRDEDLVGIKDAKQELMGWLLNEEPQRTVISVVGMGGSGKTTLVANTFNSQIKIRYFDCYAWITVSQSYTIEDLFRLMIHEFYKEAKEELSKELSTMSYRELVEMLSNFLQTKRYIVVLDDVWTTNLWREINVALPNGTNGSRVMLTTRNESVASFNFGVGSYIHLLQPLQRVAAWELFCLKAFSSNPSKCCPPEFVSLAKDLVEKCKGLPLAIVALGGLMSSKSLELDWRNVYNSLNVELDNNPELEVVKTILMLSFNDLPYRLKSCFLYCCVFPEDYNIRRKRLIRLWMAEGFVEQVRGATPEDVAEGYLMELTCRSMLQVVRRNAFGRPKECKMHALLRELALSISKTEKFCAVYDGKEAIEESSGARRMSIQAQSQEVKSGKCMLQLRSFFIFFADNISESSLNTLPSDFKLLRVLDLEDAPINKLSDELVNLFNLRYLNLTRTQVKKLPKSIGKLYNLQTLNIKESKIGELPPGVAELQNLRHLITYRYNDEHTDDLGYIVATRVPTNICKIKGLQVLTAIEIEGDLIKQLKNMTQLKTIYLTKVKEDDGEDLCVAIANMKLLRSLSLVATKEVRLCTDAMSSAPPSLKKLVLCGKLEKVPCWFNSLNSLTNLALVWSKLKEDFLSEIQELPNLVRLTLIGAYEGKQLCFLQGFQKLTILEIANFHMLNEIIVEKGVMPRLGKLRIWSCMELKTLPQGVEYLTDLRVLHLWNASNELSDQALTWSRKSLLPEFLNIPEINHGFTKSFLNFSGPS